jgi:hypothetical protein
MKSFLMHYAMKSFLMHYAMKSFLMHYAISKWKEVKVRYGILA